MLDGFHSGNLLSRIQTMEQIRNVHVHACIHSIIFTRITNMIQESIEAVNSCVQRELPKLWAHQVEASGQPFFTSWLVDRENTIETAQLSFIAVYIVRHIPFYPTKSASNRFWVIEKQLLPDVLDLCTCTTFILRLQVASGEKTNLVKIGRVRFGWGCVDHAYSKLSSCR